MYRRLPWRIHVPSDVFILYSRRTEAYRILEAAATMLYQGEPPSLLLGGGDYSIAVVGGNRFAMWALSVLLRYAPDDDARQSAVRAVWNAGIVFDPRDSPRFGWFAVADAFDKSRKSRAYALALSQEPHVRDLLGATLMETRVRSRDLLGAVGLADSPLPEPGWGSRCVEAIWSGSFPAELHFEWSLAGNYLDGPSYCVLQCATRLASDDQERRRVVDAVATVPGVCTASYAPFCRQFAHQLAFSQPAEYTSILSSRASLRRAVAEALRTSPDVGWATPEAWALVGGK